MKRLTGRQQIFAERYALTGRARQSAIAAGCNPSSAAVRANRWLKIQAVQNFVELIRDIAFEELRTRITKQVMSDVDFGLEHGLGLRRARRASRILYRLGLYKHDPFASERKRRRKQPAHDRAEEEHEKQELLRKWREGQAGEQAETRA